MMEQTFVLCYSVPGFTRDSLELMERRERVFHIHRLKKQIDMEQAEVKRTQAKWVNRGKGGRKR